MSSSDDDQFCYGTDEARNSTWTSPFFTDRVFGSREDMKNWVKNTAYSLGYVIVTQRSKKCKNGFIIKVCLVCDRSGELDGSGSSKNTSSKKTGCPFKLVGKYSFEHHYWTIRVVCDQHNHRPTEHLEAHAYARRLSDDEFRLVEDLTWKNVPPHEILSMLKDQDENNLSTLPTIYEAHKKILKVERDGKNPMQVLMSLFHTNRYVYQPYIHPVTNELQALFFVHPTSYEIWRAFPHVLIIDATYKTNIYNMPFVQIVGVTSTNKTFCIAFVFISEEKAENYKWALEQLKSTLNEGMHPRVIVTDKELALMNVDWEIFVSMWKLLEDSPMWTSYEENYEELQTFLSKYPPLDLMVKEMNREDGPHLDSSTCGCQLHNSCGLPCACRLLIYMASDECIPLDSIDIFWRTLDISPVTSLQSDSFCCDTELNHVKEHFNKQSDAGKRSILRKLVDIFNPSKTTINPPPVKQNTRGRPSLKKQQQQRKHVPPKSSRSGRVFGIDLNVEPERQSCYTNNKQQEKKHSSSCNFFEIDPNMQPRRHSSFSKSQRGQTHNSIPDLNEEPPRHSSFASQKSTLDDSFMHQLRETEKLHRQIPTIFHPYISSSSIQNVKPDGNCGFRFVALGLGLPEDYWPRILQDLVQELESRQHEYRWMFGTKDYNNIYNTVNIVGLWMVMPDTGLVIASKYNKVVVSLSNDRGCATSFPLWSSPTQSDSHEIIVIAHVNGNHYIRVDLREGFPLPATHPRWNAYKSDAASGWSDKYVSRQNIFREYYYRDPISYDLT
ncbi:FAR1-related sequence 5-like protein [Tanacetum coccineum]